MKEFIKTCFFAFLAVLLIDAGGVCLNGPLIAYKLGGVALVFLGLLSAKVVLHCLGILNNN